jgi:hypothetical protein
MMEPKRREEIGERNRKRVRKRTLEGRGRVERGER